MIEVAILYLLAVIDGAFVGYRDAVGRNPLLKKGVYYRRAFLGGVRLAHLALLPVALAALATYWSDPERFLELLPSVGRDLLWVYGIYATTVLFAFGAYRIPSHDVRAFVTISTLGTLTLLRPFVIIGGAVAAGLRAGDPVVWPTLVTLAIAFGFLQPLLARLGWNHFDWKNLRPTA